MADRIGKPVSQRQLRVGEMIKQSLGMIFSRNEAKVPNLETNTITVTEVKINNRKTRRIQNLIPLVIGIPLKSKKWISRIPGIKH